MISTRGRGLLWLALPLVAYLVVMQRLWFNAPIWDDYDAILISTVDLMDAATAKAWLGELFKLHNEHRIALTRLAAWSMAEVFGRIDFRALVLLGTAMTLGILALAWAELREQVAAPLFAAAGFLMFQTSYYEGSLMSMAATSNIGVVFLAFASLYFATRDGAAAPVCALCGVLAACTQANGLFALPLAAAGCALAGRRRRALALALVAAATWILYFQGYTRPVAHPSPMAAIEHPFDAAHLFLVILGSIVGGDLVPSAIGSAILAGIAWLAYRRFWKAHPSVALWIAFILVSAAAATVGRVGFGVFHASRYAILSTCLVVLLFLAFCSLAPLRAGRALAGAVIAAAVVSFVLTWASWTGASEYSYQGRRLAKIAPGSTGAAAERYFGVRHPARERAVFALAGAERRALYAPREVTLFAYRLHDMPTIPAQVRRTGNVDLVEVTGSRVVAHGWTDIVPLEPGRSLAVHTGAGAPIAMSAVTVERADVADLTRNAALAYSGFALVAEYADPGEAGRAAASLCVLAEAPGLPATLLNGGKAECAQKR